MALIKKRLVFTKLPSLDGTEHDERRPAPPPNTGRPKKLKDITPLEQTILERSGGKITIPDAPDAPMKGQLAVEFDAMKMTQVENLMFQGIRSPHLIAQALSNAAFTMSEDRASKYVLSVLARWQVQGAEVDIKQQRGEALGYLDLLQQTLWTQLKQHQAFIKAEDQRAATRLDYKRNELGVSRAMAQIGNLNGQLIALNTQRNQLYGLSTQTIQQMLVLDNGHEQSEVMKRIRTQNGVKEILGKFANLIEQHRIKRLSQNAIIEAT